MHETKNRVQWMALTSSCRGTDDSYGNSIQHRRPSTGHFPITKKHDPHTDQGVWPLWGGVVNLIFMKFTSNLGLARNPSGRYELVINITQT